VVECRGTRLQPRVDGSKAVQAAGAAGARLASLSGASYGDVVVHMLVNRKCRAGEDRIQGGGG
jgi:hypothetical protein